jgi:hypothetical protein
MHKVDSHLHYVDFNQETEGFEKLLHSMDEADVDKAVIFGLPVKKKWSYFETRKPHYYLDGYSSCYYYSQTDEYLASSLLKLSKEDQSRFAPLLCGFDPTDRSNVSYVEYMFDKYYCWKGIGELLLRHDELSLHLSGELPRINHPCMDELYSWSTKNNLTVLIHHNTHSVGFGKQAIYLNEVRETLDRHGNLKVVLAHLGASARMEVGDEYHNQIEELLNRYPNLYVDISWKVYDDVVCESGTPKEEYIDLIKRHSRRFLIGSDVTGHFEKKLPEQMNRYDPLLNQLPDEMASAVAGQTAMDLFF